MFFLLIFIAKTEDAKLNSQMVEFLYCNFGILLLIYIYIKLIFLSIIKPKIKNNKIINKYFGIGNKKSSLR